MIRPLTCLVVTLACLAPAVSQKVEIPVGDLVRSARIVPLIDDEDWVRENWIFRQAPPGRGSAGWLGEHELLSDVAGKAPFVRDGLQTILGSLTQLGVSGLEFEGDTLLVDRDDAAAVRAGLLQLRRQLPPPIALEVKLERVRKGDRETLLHVRQDVRAGRTEIFEDLVSRRVIRDFEVEIAQSAASANPVVGRLATGACLAVRPRVVPGKGELLVELFARVAGDAVVMPIAHGDGIGPIDRAARQLDEAGFAMRVPHGARRTVHWTAANGDRIEITCSGSWKIPQPVPNRGPLVRCRGLFHRPVVEFQTDSLPFDEADFGFSAEQAFRRAGAERVQVVTDENSSVDAIVVHGAKAEQIDANIATRLARRLRSAVLEVTMFDVAADAAVGDIKTLGVPLAQVSSQAIVGKSVAFSGRTEMRFVRDHDIEVAQSARIPDPKVDILRHGYHVDARVLEAPDGSVGAVALRSSVSRLVRIDTVNALISRVSRAGGVADKKGSISPSIVLPKDVVGIESPVLKRHSLSTIARLDAKGSAVLRRAAPRLLGKGRDLVVVIQVKK